jgi:hypothetical protein
MHATLVDLFHFGHSAVHFVQREIEPMGATKEHTALVERQEFDIVVIGAGQAGLAVGYYLRHTPYSWIILDAEPGSGAAWRHGWDSLRLFLPAQWSLLPDWPMPGGTDGPPTRDAVLPPPRSLGLVERRGRPSRKLIHSCGQTDD